MRTSNERSLVLALAALLVSCGDAGIDPTRPPVDPPGIAAPAEAAVVSALRQTNRRYADWGIPVAVVRAEYTLIGGDPDAPTTAFAGDGVMRRVTRWMQQDPRRPHPHEISYGVFAPLALAYGTLDSEPAIDRAVESWRADPCFRLPLVKRGIPDSEVPSMIRNTDPAFFPSIDIVHLGYVPNWYFDLIFGAGGATTVLGATFTFVWGEHTAGGFVPSDLDGDGRSDTALKEIWYNDVFEWSTAGTGGEIDVETLALHELGHALELRHSGRIARSNGGFVASPRAAMNAFFLGPLRQPREPDSSALCSVWAGWGD